ncbi:MAG: biotin--[acetyl-CoA-carboxylase] ligase, partial [Acidisphaera sp.]|nr:biotin--[acetyl-CoA-carboxylase] ligase [Acidisphaera sp.]
FFLEVLEETDSTSTEVMRRATPGLAILARRQTQGRGRAGRVWQSLDGNLHLSVLLHPAGPAHRSLLAAVALHDALGAPALRLKWPNDVLLAGRKLAGILCEVESGSLVIGFGVNLATCPPGAACAAELGPAPDPEAFARRLLDALAGWMARYRNEGFAPIRTAWLAAAHAPGETIRATLGGQTVTGTYEGLDEDGALLLRANGRRLAIRSGEIAGAADPA